MRSKGDACFEAFPLRGLLRLAILCIVKRRSTYGGEIHREIRRLFNIDVPKSLVYILLRRMEKRGLVASRWDIRDSGPARRMYTITDVGLDHLSMAVERLKRAIPVIETIISIVEEG